MTMTAAGFPMLAGFFGGWEIVLVFTVILIVAAARILPGAPPPPRDQSAIDQRGDAEVRPTRLDELILWIAQGLDAGRIPFAPGTFGSVIGLLWFAVLLVPASLALFLVGISLGLVLSVFVCGEAERILKQTDPGSVVMDEITAMPVCFLPWVLRECLRRHTMPPAEAFFSGGGLVVTAIVFVLFRILDVLKPWPIHQSQGLPGGLGVTMDDFLAATYVAIITLFFVA
jgi:phosphatidylglycerophosphatase A